MCEEKVKPVITAECDRVALRDQFATTAPITIEQVLEVYGDPEADMQGDHTRAAVYAVWSTLRYEYADAMMVERVARTAPAAVAKPVPAPPGVMEALEDVLGYLARVRQIPEVRQALECVYWPADHPVFKAHTVLAEAKAKPVAPVADSDGWIEWGGGSCPVPEEVFVDIRIKDGGELSGPAGDFMWEHPLASWNEIVFYRVVKP